MGATVLYEILTVKYSGRSTVYRVVQISIISQTISVAGRTSLWIFVVRKQYQNRQRSKRLLGWVQLQICSANLYSESYPFAERGKNPPLLITWMDLW